MFFFVLFSSIFRCQRIQPGDESPPVSNVFRVLSVYITNRTQRALHSTRVPHLCHTVKFQNNVTINVYEIKKSEKRACKYARIVSDGNGRQLRKGRESIDYRIYGWNCNQISDRIRIHCVEGDTRIEFLCTPRNPNEFGLCKRNTNPNSLISIHIQSGARLFGLNRHQLNHTRVKISTRVQFKLCLSYKNTQFSNYIRACLKQAGEWRATLSVSKM